MSKVHEYEGSAIRITYDARRCIHAAECVRGLPEVFDTDRRPWIDADGAEADEVSEVIRRCPTGALQYERIDGGAQESPAAEAEIRVTADGPLFVSGDVVVLDAGTRVLTRETRAAFCRCGASANQPWCDGSHTEAGFRATADIGEGRPKPCEQDDPTPLSIRLRTNGPLVLVGPFRIGPAVPEGHVRGGGCALCRCGASGNKPWCDGSHKVIGFESDDPVAG
ncbi:MAG: CDGSH iron-sulfur domain-containing protein [Gemmatimonadota bacterium]